MNVRVRGAVVFALVVLCTPLRAGALEVKLFGQPLRIDITESMFFPVYHGDLGGLIIEHDAPPAGSPPGTLGPARPENHFWAFLNRLNVDLAWKRWRLATRFDSGVFFDTPAGSCGPPMTTPIALRSKFCGVINTDPGQYAPGAVPQWPLQTYFWPEKVSLEYSGRSVEATLGDFYISFGRGLVLSLRKLDELGIDTTLQGARFVLHEGPVGAVLAVGVTNIQNLDEATGRFAPDPFDLIAAGRVEYRFLDKILVGLHEVGGVQHQNIVTDKPIERDSTLMYGGTIDAPRLLRWLGVYFEGAGQMMQASGKRETGYALYSAITTYAGPVSLLFEVKHYVHFQRWRSSVDASLPEFAPIVYNQPPTAERIQTELVSPIYDVSGARVRADYRVNRWMLLYASYGFFEDRQASGSVFYHDPYAGAELRWSQGSSHLFPSGGYRIERCDGNNRDCRSTSPGDEFQHIGHVEWDAAQALPHRLSIETQGFALFRRGDKVAPLDPSGNPTYPSWTEGDAYLALKWTPYLVFTGGMEWTTRPSARVNQYFWNGAIQWNITTASSVRLFIGGTRGGLKCVSGICRDFPPFTGARLELVLRL